MPDACHITETGQGVVRRDDSGNFHLSLPAVPADAYSNAQIASYATRAQIALRPPLRLAVRAWAQGELRGTAGFGLWNHPFSPDARGVRLPRAAWFFHATPPNDMQLAYGVPGHGWKAATIDALNPLFLSLLPFAPVGVLMMRVPALYRALWRRVAQPALRVSEQALPAQWLNEPRTYLMEWHTEQVRFWVDGEQVHQTRFSPGGRLGFVAWVDNQYAVVTPQGRFGFGVVGTTAPQSLHLERLSITNL